MKDDTKSFIGRWWAVLRPSHVFFRDNPPTSTRYSTLTLITVYAIVKAGLLCSAALGFAMMPSGAFSNSPLNEFGPSLGFGLGLSPDTFSFEEGGDLLDSFGMVRIAVVVVL